MIEDTDILAEIDARRAMIDTSNLASEELLKKAGQFVGAVAANELAYELASSANLNSHLEVSFEGIANDISLGRLGLNATLEAAILEKKQSLRSEHEERVLREQLMLPFDES